MAENTCHSKELAGSMCEGGAGQVQPLDGDAGGKKQKTRAAGMVKCGNLSRNPPDEDGALYEILEL